MTAEECKACDWREYGYYLLEEVKSIKAQLQEMAAEMKTLKGYTDRRVEAVAEKVAEEQRRLSERTEKLTERAAVTETKLWFIVAAASGLSSVVGGLIVKHFGG